MLVDFRIGIRNFFKKHGKKIIIGLVIWGIVLVINYFVGKISDENFQIDTNYKPHESIMDNGDVPQKLRDPITELIGEFIKNCNSKNYEVAYNLLSEECRKNIYPDIEDFKTYVDYIFTTNKIYNIQNFSNKDNKYIYNVTILDDILATGFNNEEEMEYYEEKYVITDNNGELQLSIREYIGSENLTYMYEDEYMKIKIESVDKKYENVTYNFTIANKSEKTIVFADYTEDYEIALDTSEGTKRTINELLEPVVLHEGETKNYSFKYTIFFDEETQINSMIFDHIRIYEDKKTYENGAEPEKKFSIKVKF